MCCITAQWSTVKQWQSCEDEYNLQPLVWVFKYVTLQTPNHVRFVITAVVDHMITVILLPPHLLEQQWAKSVLWCETTLSNEELSVKASVLLKKSFTTTFISHMKAAQTIKKRSLWKWVQKPFNLSHLPLNNCKFPLGPMGEGLSVPLPPYQPRPYFSMLSGSLSTQPPASSRRGLWGSWAPGPAIVLAWEGSPERALKAREKEY